MKLINYPAMASPASMNIISTEINEKLKPGSNILDPYCGTGRLLFDSRSLGHSVTGIDCSPVAVLTARVGHQGNDLRKVARDYKNIVNLFTANNNSYEMSEEYLFWFPRTAYCDLRRILESVDEASSSLNVKRFFWLVLVQVARVSSYTRDEEYKAHRISQKARNNFKPDVLGIFCKTYTELYARISRLGHDKPGRYRFIQGDFSSVRNLHSKYDALITSPPYGDSISTVGYGQFARIPLLILSHSRAFCEEYDVSSGKGSLDTFCLGGGNCVTIEKPEVPPQVRYLDKGPMKKFCYDYFYRLMLVSDRLSDDSYCGFVLADRTYKKEKFPLIESTISYMQKMGFNLVAKKDRYLSLKRLPRSMRLINKEEFSSHQGMNYESVIIMKR